MWGHSGFEPASLDDEPSDLPLVHAPDDPVGIEPHISPNKQRIENYNKLKVRRFAIKLRVSGMRAEYL